MMIAHAEISDHTLRQMLRQGDILSAGHRKLKIYGTLHCASGRRMQRKNRVFFSTDIEAVQHGFRPCGHCMRQQYLAWKNELI